MAPNGYTSLMTRTLAFIHAGALPNAVATHPAFAGNPGPYKLHPRRSERGDRLVSQAMAARGWSVRKQAHFLNSLQGLFAANDLTFGDRKALVRLRPRLDAFDR